MSIYVLDFQDSFTYNVASEIYKRDRQVQVIAFRDLPLFLKSFHEKLKQDRSPQVLVYGPGPGSPDNYLNISQEIRSLFRYPHLFHLGICLGHQLLWSLRGIGHQKRQHPAHGVTQECVIPAWEEFFPAESWGKKIQVQTYHSLVLQLNQERAHLRSRQLYQTEKFSFVGDECLMGHFPRGLTYQFHPESVGTENSKIFFDPLFAFLYNGKMTKESYGHSFIENRRSL